MQRRRPRAFAPSVSMELKHPVHGSQLGWLDQPRMRDGDGEQRSVELFLPEREKVVQRRKFWKEIVVLPDECLQQRRVIRHPIENLRRRQTVTQHLFPEVFGNNPNPRDHANLHLRSAFVVVADLPSHPAEMRSHERNVTHATNASQAQMVKGLLKIIALAAAYRTC